MADPSALPPSVQSVEERIAAIREFVQKSVDKGEYNDPRYGIGVQTDDLILLLDALQQAGRDSARIDYLETCLGDGSEGAEDENVSLWRDYEVPEGCDPSYAISGYWCSNNRGTSLREAIDAAMSPTGAERP